MTWARAFLARWATRVSGGVPMVTAQPSPRSLAASISASLRLRVQAWLTDSRLAVNTTLSSTGAPFSGSSAYSVGRHHHRRHTGARGGIRTPTPFGHRILRRVTWGGMLAVRGPPSMALGASAIEPGAADGR